MTNYQITHAPGCWDWGRMDPLASRFDPDFPLPIRRWRFLGWVEAEIDSYVNNRSKT